VSLTRLPKEFACTSCEALPGEPCRVLKGPNKGKDKPPRHYHLARDQAAYQASHEDARKEAWEQEERENRSFCLSLSEPINDGEDLLQWLNAWLRIEVERKITCPEEGMPDDVDVVLLLGKHEISRARL
jgi:hypothetical protein